MALAAVFLVSLSSLGYEILLTRTFAFAQWNHLSFMVISIVMFGSATSGTVLSLLEQASPGCIRSWLSPRRLLLLVLAYCAAAAASYLLLRLIPLDYFRIPLEAAQAAYLLLTYLLLLVPFVLAGAVVGLAFAGAPQRSGLTYAASMVGSASGAVLLALALPLLAAPGARLLEPRPSPYKLLAQALQLPGARLSDTHVSLRARVDELQTPYIRFAPGLSLKYQGSLPRRRLLVRDGDELFALADLSDAEGLAFVRYTHGFAAYELAGAQANRPLSVLVLLQGGGSSLAAAAAGAADRATVLVEPSAVADALRETAVPPGLALEVRQGGLRLGLRALAAAPRAERGFDVAQIEAWGPSVPGIGALSEEPLLTVESLGVCLDCLAPQGILGVSRRLLLPPSDSVRLFAAAMEALRRRAVPDPASHILALRGWDSYTLLVSPSAFGETQVERLREFCERRNFDLLFYAGMAEEEANRFNRFPEPFHYRQLQELSVAQSEGRAAEHLRKHYLDLRPSTDDRPYHNRFARWSRLGALYRVTGSRLYSLLLSGEVVVLVVLAAAVLLGGVLLALPALPALARRAGRGRGPHAAHRAGTGRGVGAGPGRLGGLPALYFLAAGAGYMFLEMGLIQVLTVVLGHPVVALTAVLALLLLFSGAGGALSARWPGRRLRAATLALFAAAAALVPLTAAARSALLGGGAPAWPHAAAPLLAGLTGLAAGLTGLLAGLPFPCGMRLLLADPGARARAWAANGTASVLASILSLPLAMSLGISRLFVAAAGCYGLVAGIAWLMAARGRWKSGAAPARPRPLAPAAAGAGPTARGSAPRP